MSNQVEVGMEAGCWGDERLRFYLRHRAQIEEWSLLGREVRKATVEAFAGIEPAMVALAASFGEDVRYVIRAMANGHITTSTRQLGSTRTRSEW